MLVMSRSFWHTESFLLNAKGADRHAACSVYIAAAAATAYRLCHLILAKLASKDNSKHKQFPAHVLLGRGLQINRSAVYSVRCAVRCVLCSVCNVKGTRYACIRREERKGEEIRGG